MQTWSGLGRQNKNLGGLCDVARPEGVRQQRQGGHSGAVTSGAQIWSRGSVFPATTLQLSAGHPVARPQGGLPPAVYDLWQG